MSHSQLSAILSSVTNIATNRPVKLRKRRGRSILSSKDTRKTINEPRKLNLDLVIQILDTQPDFYETRLAGMLRQFMRSSHNERWDGEKDLYQARG